MQNFVDCPWENLPIDLSKEKLSSAQKQWFATQINKYGFKPIYLANQFKLNRKTISRYGIQQKKKIITQSGKGRPRIFSPKAICEIGQKLNRQKYQMRTKTYKEFLQGKAVESAAERNIGASNVKKVSKRSIGRLETELSIKTGNGELTTNARAIATEDIRNVVSFAAMNVAMSSVLKEEALVLNADATQYEVGYDVKKDRQVKFITKDEGPLKILPHSKDAGITKYTIKYFCLMSASGCIANPIYIIQDDKMKEDLIDVHEVKGLGVHTGANNKGYVVFCQSRSCNLNFYKWFNENVLTEFIIELKDSENLSKDAVTWFQLDGEGKQIEIYKDSTFSKLFSDNNIVVGKPPASTTEITQPCDRGNLFKASKTKLRSISDENVKNDKKLLILQNIFKKHIQTFNGSTIKSKMTTAHVKMGTLGLLRVQNALQDVTKKSIVKDSFHLTGIYDKDLLKCNVNTMLKSCKAPIPIDLENNILSNMDELACRIEKNGELFESDFDELDIVSNINLKGKPKDQLIISRKRSVFLLNTELLNREKEKISKQNIQKESLKRKREAREEKKK
jgi:hypothetical protein